MENFLTADESIILSESKAGLPVIKVRGESGRWVTLHSMIDPVKESRIMAENINVSEKDIPVILGIGMGYHLFEIINRLGNSAIVVIEKDEGVLNQFLSVNADDKRLTRNNLLIISAKSPIEVIDKISRFQMDNNLKAFRVIEHAPSVRAFSTFYLDVKSRIESMGKLNIGSKMYYQKFKDEKVKILILHSKYYLLPEMINSIKSLGHEQKVLMVRSGIDGEGSTDVIENIITEIIDFKPDFILTVNHLGFDREGILTDFFTEIKIPYASWYIDNPMFIMDVFKNQVSDYLSIFAWDKDYLEDLKNQGFNNVFYLPLATDPEIFKCSASGLPVKYNCDIGFVGSSWVNVYNQCIEIIGDKSETLHLIDKLSDQYIRSTEKDSEKINFRLTHAEKDLYQFNLNNFRTEFLPAVTWRATQKYRLSCINEILPYKPRIHGDSGWKNFLNGNSILLPELNYYDELPQFFLKCKINFNTTCQQMKTGINQRVFDVPSTGSFLLTDYRSQIEEHYELGKEVICYRETDEIGDLVSFYLKNDTARQKIVEKAYNRTCRDHTYKNRMDVMINKMKEIYA